MRGNRNRCVSALLSGLMLCMAGCSADSKSSGAQITQLPPLVTATADTQAATEPTEPPVEVADPLYQGDFSAWELPEELGTLQEVRVCADTVYLLGAVEDETNQRLGRLYRASISDAPDFTPVFLGADDINFMGLMDFDVLSDGTVCGLICENSNAIPYEDPTFDPDTFDWDAYYENYATRYRLVWYDQSGWIAQSLWLSTLLDLDSTARQTMAFTGVRCDGGDQIYLTATIDDQECLMALDNNQNLCMIQGSSDKRLALESGYQLVRCGQSGMLLLEKGQAADEMALYHITVADDALWKTQDTVPTHLTAASSAAQDTRQEGWMGFWDETGIYQSPRQSAESTLLYNWKELGQDVSRVAQTLLLSGDRVLLVTYNARGELTLQLVVPEGYEDTQPSTTQPSGNGTESAPATTQTAPPVATPLTTLAE